MRALGQEKPPTACRRQSRRALGIRSACAGGLPPPLQNEVAFFYLRVPALFIY